MELLLLMNFDKILLRTNLESNVILLYINQWFNNKYIYWFKKRIK